VISTDTGRSGKSSMAGMVTTLDRVPWSVGGQYFRVLRFGGMLTLGCGPAAPLDQH
jgi:hypothetical protein